MRRGPRNFIATPAVQAALETLLGEKRECLTYVAVWLLCAYVLLRLENCCRKLSRSDCSPRSSTAERTAFSTASLLP